MKTPAQQKLAACKLQACREWPYASTAVLSLGANETSKVPDLAVDQYWRLYYNPEWVLNSTIDEVVAKIIPDVAHLLLKHAARGEMAIPANDKQAQEEWNKAADMAAYGLLPHKIMARVAEESNPSNSGFKGGLTVESYFRQLMEKARDKKPEDGPGPPKPDGGSGEGSGAGSGAGTPAPAGESGTPGQGDGESQGGAEPGEAGSPEEPACHPGGPEGPACHPGGSAGDGQPRDWELPPPELAAGGKAPGVQPHEAEQLIRDMAERAKKAGKLPGNMQSYVDGIFSCKLDPKKLLTGVIVAQTNQVTNGSGDKYSYARPSRRARADGMLRPKPFNRVPQIVVVVDTSGSMSERDLKLSLGLVDKVIKGLHMSSGLRVIAGDTEAQSDQIVTDVNKIELKGGGGTEMDVLIENLAQDRKHKPDLCIVCTDGYTEWPSKKVKFPVVACLTGDCATPPDWIKTVNLKEYCQEN